MCVCFGTPLLEDAPEGESASSAPSGLEPPTGGFPPNAPTLSLSTNADTTLPSALSDLLMPLASSSLSPAARDFAAFSQPARSTRKSFADREVPGSIPGVAAVSFEVSTRNPTMRCDLDESALRPVRPTARRAPAALTLSSATFPPSRWSTATSTAPRTHTPRCGHVATCNGGVARSGDRFPAVAAPAGSSRPRLDGELFVVWGGGGRRRRRSRRVSRYSSTATTWTEHGSFAAALPALNAARCATACADREGRGIDSPRQRIRWSVRASRRERERGDREEARVDSTRPGNEALVAVAASAGALHRVCLARAALPVRHDGGVDAADAHVVERWGEARARDVVVARARVENRVKGEGGGRGVLRGGGVGGGGGRGGDDADLARVDARVHGGGRAAGAGGVARRAHAAHDARVARAAHRARGCDDPSALS